MATRGGEVQESAASADHVHEQAEQLVRRVQVFKLANAEAQSHTTGADVVRESDVDSATVRRAA